VAEERDPPAFEPRHFARLDEAPDGAFYELPRIVTHIDDDAIAALAAHYGRVLKDGDRILDLMSSCVSHLPRTLKPGRVAGLGMNMAELDANPRLDERIVRDLNRDPALPYGDGAFDACLIAVSIQYLTRPVEVVREIARVLRPGGILAVSFSNRMFPTKAVALWRALGDGGHAALVGEYIVRAGGFADPESFDLSPAPGLTDPIYVVQARRR
jgi:SAM-dependent methyltransferase